MKTPWTTAQPARIWVLQQRAIFDWFEQAEGRREDREERNIVYMAVTRTKETLVMVRER